MHFLVFDRAPQPFDENIVHETTASVHRNIGDVAGPDMIGLGDAHAAQQIGIDPVAGVENCSFTVKATNPFSQSYIERTFSITENSLRLHEAVGSSLKTCSEKLTTSFVPR